MCVLARLNNHEFLAFYVPIQGSEERNGRIELRDEDFQAIPLDEDADVLILDEENAARGWQRLPFPELRNLVRTRMHESLVGLGDLFHQA